VLLCSSDWERGSVTCLEHRWIKESSPVQGALVCGGLFDSVLIELVWAHNLECLLSVGQGLGGGFSHEGWLFLGTSSQ